MPPMADWSDTGEAYATSFARLCEGAARPLLDAVEAARPAAAGSFLDVGTGPGTVATVAAARGYDVMGVDAEESMIAAARRRHPELFFLEATLPDLPFPSARFDVVAAGFILNHVPDPALAVTELARVTAPGGAVAVTVWPPGRSPLRPMWEATLARSGVATYPADTIAAESLTERTPDGLAGLLAGAGLERVQASTPSWTFTIAPDELWAGVMGGVATIGGLYRALDDEGRRALRRAYVEVTAAMVDDRGHLQIPHAAVLAVGIRTPRD